MSKAEIRMESARFVYEGSTLSRRRVEVLLWSIEGKTRQEVALILGISPRTVEVTREGIYKSFGVSGLVNMCVHALVNGLVKSK